jgi:pimeloyl-ACP methyl ester carboxylesterase
MDAYSSPLTSVAVLTKTFNDLGLKGEHELSEAECFGYVAPMREGADPALYQFFTSINAKLFTALDENKTRFADYKGDTLVMWGAKDETLTVRQIPILKDMLSIPDENIHIYSDNAHFLAEEIPDEIIKKVSAFLTP